MRGFSIFRSNTKEAQLQNINSQIVGIKMNLDLVEQQVTQGINAINDLRAHMDNLAYNLKLLKEPGVVINIKAYRQSNNDVRILGQRIKQSLAIYNNVKTQRDALKTQYDKGIIFRDKFVEEHFTDAKVLIFKRKNDVEKYIERGDKK